MTSYGIMPPSRTLGTGPYDFYYVNYEMQFKSEKQLRAATRSLRKHTALDFKIDKKNLSMIVESHEQERAPGCFSGGSQLGELKDMLKDICKPSQVEVKVLGPGTYAMY